MGGGRGPDQRWANRYTRNQVAVNKLLASGSRAAGRAEGEAVANRWAWRAHGLFCASPCKDDYRISIPNAYSPAENTCCLGHLKMAMCGGMAISQTGELRRHVLGAYEKIPPR